MKNKKYYSIAEVCEVTGVPAHKLRYLEKATPDIQIFKIRGRRYYTQVDIHNIKIKFGVQDSINEINNIAKAKDNSEILSKIDDLLSKFSAFLTI
jgi:DNA-binding transcriptional MerR regulator